MAAQPITIRDETTGLLGTYIPVVTSTGATDAGAVPALDDSGHLDPTMLPPGIGADVFTGTVAEALSAGDFINGFSDAGVFSVRKADNSNGRPAHGFVLEAYNAAETATVYFLGGINTALAGLTVGSAYHLGTAGGVTATALATNATGKIAQRLGIAQSATALLTSNDTPWIL
jgi:hypothetical protein